MTGLCAQAVPPFTRYHRNIMRIILYFLFLVTSFQHIAASCCEDEGLQKAILVLKTSVDRNVFFNPTAFAQHRGRAAHSLTRHYKKAYEECPEYREQLIQEFSGYAKSQKEGGLLIDADYIFGSIPIEFGICLGEIFGRLDLAEPLMLGLPMTKDRTYGLKELFRGYMKHWETCLHRQTHPYRSDWLRIKSDQHLYECCFRIMPILHVHYNPHEASMHHHFLGHSFIQAEKNFTENGFDEALRDIREILKDNKALITYRRPPVISASLHPVPQQEQNPQDSTTEKSALDIAQG